MYSFDTISLSRQSNPALISKQIHLDSDLDLFFLIETNDSRLTDLLDRKILDASLGNIDLQNVYKDFSGVLENINGVLRTWRQDAEQKPKVHMVAGVLHRNTFLFSTVWRASCYLIKAEGEVLEITDSKDKPEEFVFISNGKLDVGDTISMSSRRLFKYLSESDFSDSLRDSDVEHFHKNISLILNEELWGKDIIVSSFMYYLELGEPATHKWKDVLFRMLDNAIVKRAIAWWMMAVDKMIAQKKYVKNAAFVGGIIVSFILLYVIISGVIAKTVDNRETINSKELIVEARQYIKLAGDNTGNPDMFDVNIKKAEELVSDLKDKNIFLDDVQRLLDDITVMKKQFNGVESFDETVDNALYTGDVGVANSLLKLQSKTYIVTKNSVVWPLETTGEPLVHIFSDLGDDSFVDAVALDDVLVLLTSGSKIVTFDTTGFFRYADVAGQAKWEEAASIATFGNNIYLQGRDNQIYKHAKSGNNFKEWQKYLSDADVADIGSVLDIAIDGGFYILKSDLSMLKFFASPKYRLESLTINKAPKNYDVENSLDPVRVKTRQELNYVYMLLNNKIWVFQPNTKSVYDTQSLQYIGQVEGKRHTIRDFYIDHDGELLVLNDAGVYQLQFEVSDGKLILR